MLRVMTALCACSVLPAAIACELTLLRQSERCGRSGSVSRNWRVEKPDAYRGTVAHIPREVHANPCDLSCVKMVKSDDLDDAARSWRPTRCNYWV